MGYRSLLVLTQQRKYKAICVMKKPYLYPLLVERKFVYRLWGGRRIIEWLNLPEPDLTNIGETWEVFERNPVRNGSLTGQTLEQVTQHYQEELVGTHVLEQYGVEFPILIKFLDANQDLSIQVHPDDTYAHVHEPETGFHGKTESWYILNASEDAAVIHGLQRRVSREKFRQAAQENTLEQYIRYTPVKPGDVVFTPPGTLHAINAGLLLFEVQQKSDITYRVYDYGRRDPATGEQRELHLDKALDVLRLSPYPKPKTTTVALDAPFERTLLAACKHFAMEHWHLPTSQMLLSNHQSMNILTVIEGRGSITWESMTLDLTVGDSVIIPATLGSYVLTPASSNWRMLHVYVPDIMESIIPMLYRLGLSDSAIEKVVFEV